jgi:putative transposase
MYKAYKYRIYPTQEQITKIDHQINCNRFVYNLALETKIYTYEQFGKNLSSYDLQKQLTDLKQDLPWLQEVDSQSLQRSITNMCEAFARFYKGAGYPKFKSRASKQSFTCHNNIRRVDFNKNTITITKIKNIPAIISRAFEGEVREITISKTPTGKYFASVLVKTKEVIPVKAPVKNSIGIDLGLKDFIITSEGIKVDNPRHLREYIHRLKVLQKRASRKNKGSNNRKKANLKVALIYEKITNQRLDFIHKVTSKLVNDNQVDTFFISDVSWYKFREILSYKCEWKGKNLIFINRFAPSSKTCSECGYIKDQLLLSEREFNCNSCGNVIDRDINAAINIKNFGLRISGAGCSVEPVEKSAIVGSMKQEILPIGGVMPKRRII